MQTGGHSENRFMSLFCVLYYILYRGYRLRIPSAACCALVAHNDWITSSTYNRSKKAVFRMPSGLQLCKIMRMRKKPNLNARLEKCAHLIVGEPAPLRGRWLDEFGYGELHIELGCGKGLFTVETAKNDAGVFIAALEKSADAMVIALERAAAANLRNARFVNGLAEHLADYFADGEASRIYINFCDPWPSNRHAKRRLTNRRFLEVYERLLRPGGELHFKTDNAPLFDYSLREFDGFGFEPAELTRNLHENGAVGQMTDYENKFYIQNLPICRCVMRKCL